MIRIALVQDKEQELEKLCAFMSAQRDISVIGTGKDEYDAVKMTMRQPDSIILCTGEKDIGGPDMIPIIKRYSPFTAAILQTASHDETYIFRCLAAGVSGYVLKTGGKEELARAVRIVYQGGVYYSPQIGNRITGILSRYSKKTPRGNNPLPENLTRTEVKILCCVGRGQSNEEISRCLYLAQGTIRNRVSAILKKLGLRDRSALTAFSVRQGFDGLFV